MFDPFAHFAHAELKNGIPVYLHHVPDCGYAYVDLVFRVGAQHDDVQCSGTAHFVEHMACANSSLDLTERKRFFADFGGKYHAITSFFATWYGFKLPVAHPRFDEALRFWAGATLGGSLTEHFDREKSVIESEIRRKYPSEEAMRLETEINQQLYRGTFRALAPSPAGTLESLSRITHAAAKRFHQQHYTAANVSVVCVGDVSLRALVEKLESALGHYHGGEVTTSSPSLTKIPPREAVRTEYQESHVHKPKRARVSRHSLLPTSMSAEIVSIMSRVISSILTTELRDKRGLVYSAGSGSKSIGICRAFDLGAEEFGIEHLPAVEQVLRDTIDVLPHCEERFLKEQEAELRAYAMYDVPWRTVQDSAVADIALIGRIRSRQEEFDECAALTVEDWREATEYLQKDDGSTTTIILK